MNITLFGGSFNPPHLGHQIVLDQAFGLIPNLDQIWLLPDYQHSFAKNRFLIPAQHRLKMAQMLTSPKIKLQTCVVDLKMPGRTIDHLRYLLKAYPQHRFSFLLGSDNLKDFHLWEEYRLLIKLIPFYVYPRLGYGFKPLYPNMQPLQSPDQIITNISSTMIRNRLKNNLKINHLLPEKIYSYLKQNSLF
ncbi:MAG: nicotinate (nicotinamide) nucleotide adenylyltransferase [Candidatus Beckwithbacteria bacterium]